MEMTVVTVDKRFLEELMQNNEIYKRICSDLTKENIKQHEIMKDLIEDHRKLSDLLAANGANSNRKAPCCEKNSENPFSHLEDILAQLTQNACVSENSSVWNKLPSNAFFSQKQTVSQNECDCESGDDEGEDDCDTCISLEDIEVLNDIQSDMHRIYFGLEDVKDPLIFVIKRKLAWLNALLSEKERKLAEASKLKQTNSPKVSTNVQKVRQVKSFGDANINRLNVNLNKFLSELDYEFAQPVLHYSSTENADEGEDYMENVMVEYFVEKEG